jgi:Ca2+-binding RTX toxin-like protein
MARVRPGTGKALRAGMLALAVGVLAAPAAGAGGSHGGITFGLQGALGGGARSAATANVLTLDAPDVNNRITAFTAPTGRLTLTSPEGFSNPPPAPSGQCVQDSPTQVSCNPGYITVILGDLGGGEDSFDGSGLIDVRIGDLTGGVRRPLSGGLGNDRVLGGGGPDLLDGAGGGDSLIGSGGEDLLSGGAGKDRLSGGAAPDVLYGGGGGDKLNGGAAKDGCSGGGGRDSGKSCEFLKSIP